MKVTGGNALKITKATNPLANDTDAMETSENNDIEPPPKKKPRLLSKKSQRKKKTVPKLQKDTGSMHVQVSALNTPPVTPPNGCVGQAMMELELMKGIRSSSYEDDELPLDVLVNMENYRRFSSRTRKKPDFFHVSQMVPADGLQPQKAVVGLKRNVSVPPARRMLRFEPLTVKQEEDTPPSLDKVEEQDLAPDKPDEVDVQVRNNVIKAY